jgi:hypothetical protein
MIGKTSEKIAEEIKNNPFSGVFPPPEKVEECANFIFRQSPWNNGTSGTSSSGDSTETDTPGNGADCSPCSVVPGGGPENKKHAADQLEGNGCDKDNLQETRI